MTRFISAGGSISESPISGTNTTFTSFTNSLAHNAFAPIDQNSSSDKKRHFNLLPLLYLCSLGYVYHYRYPCKHVI